MKLGFFDSGLGGKLILEAVRAQLPQYDYAYYGDTAHVPYGERSEEEIYQLTEVGVTYLLEAQQCALVVIACNTASAQTLRRLQDEYLPAAYPDRKILGVIIPTIEAVLATDCRRVLLLGTSRTVGSGKYQLELGKRQALHTTIEAVAMPTLVPYIEAGQIDSALADVQTLSTQRQAQGNQYDGIILGCTHYSVLAPELRDWLSDGVHVFAQTEIIPDKLQLYLATHPALEQRLTKQGSVHEHLTGG